MLRLSVDQSTNQQLNKSTNSYSYLPPLLLALTPLLFFWPATLGHVVLAEGDAVTPSTCACQPG